MVCIGLLIIYLVISIARQLVDLTATGQLVPQHHPRDIAGFITRRNLHVAISDPADIQDWMTFDFLDKTFGIPPSYLQGQFRIQDARYPNLSIRRYAALSGQSVTTTLANVKDAVSNVPRP